MKSVFIVLATVVICGASFWLLWGRREPAEPLPLPPAPTVADNSTPSGAVAGLLDSLISWDLGLAAQISGELPDGIFSGAYSGVLIPVLARLEYDVGNERITGNTAVVDVGVTAVDVASAMDEIAAAAKQYLTRCLLERQQSDIVTFLRDYLYGIDVSTLTRVRREASVHLARDDAGKWRLDLNNPENSRFWNAAAGGLPDLADSLSTLSRQFFPGSGSGLAS